MKKTLNVLVVTVITLLSGLALHAEEPEAQAVVNINTATVEQLALLPRIGPKVAQRIVDWRDKYGPFERSTDLMQVRGIGENTFEILEKYLVLEGDTTLEVKQKVPRKPAPPKTAG